MNLKAKQNEFLRLGDLSSEVWRPLSLNQLKKLNSIKLTEGSISIDRELLALLLGERERLIYVAETARWLSELLEESELFPKVPIELDPPALERAVFLLKKTLVLADAIQTDVETFDVC